jgi:hypothetical protein
MAAEVNEVIVLGPPQPFQLVMGFETSFIFNQKQLIACGGFINC